MGGTVRNGSHHSIYMGQAVELTTLENGAVTNAAARERLRATSYLEPVIEVVAPGVTVLGGYGFVNVTVIEGTDGLIVYDTGENLDDGAQFLELVRSISKKPIVALLYSHSHYVHGAQSFVDDSKSVLIVGHPSVNANANGAGSSVFPETAPLQSSRVRQQFGGYLPQSGPNAPAGAEIRTGRSGFVPVNTPVQNGQRMDIAGVQMQFFTRYGSDTDDCLTVHLPERGVVLNNLFWPFFPNIYTLRGAKFRDPREWQAGLKVIRDLKPEVLVNTHARTVRGALTVQTALENVIDGLSVVLDQTLRGILRGLGPDELRTFVKLPAHLAKFPNLAEVYGEISHFGPYLFNHALGWFDGDAATINPLPPIEQATRLVGAMGGFAAVLTNARSAFAANEFSWAAQLVGYLQRIDPASQEVRTLKADILERMGHVTPAHTVRNWYLSQVRALRGEVKVPRLQFADPRVLMRSEPAVTLDQYRVRIDPERSAHLNIVGAISIADREVRHAWHLRRGVVEFVCDPEAYGHRPDFEIAVSFENWVRFFSCRISRAEFLASAQITKGDAAQVDAFFAAFDHFDPVCNSIVPV